MCLNKIFDTSFNQATAYVEMLTLLTYWQKKSWSIFLGDSEAKWAQFLMN